VKIVHQIAASVTPGDAVTDQAFAWRAALRNWGYASEIIAEHVDEGVAAHVLQLDSARERLLDAHVLVVHYSVWSRTVELALDAPGEVVLCYHNVTPAELLREYSPGLARLCERARAALPSLRDRCAGVITFSQFSASELRDFGLDAKVVPLLLNLPSQPLDSASTGEPVVLFVGRVAPNKRLEDAIRAFAVYQQRHAPAASFAIVGSPVEFERYQAELQRLADELGARVRFTGRVSREERDRWYRRASAYLSTSVHEGFCAPLLEAIAHGVPVVARAEAAVPETLGDAGLLIDGSDPERFAEALHQGISSQPTRDALRLAGARRLAELDPVPVTRRLRAALEPVLSEQAGCA
jgi:glycosyltransferase involved in cell wall biosynthesis